MEERIAQWRGDAAREALAAAAERTRLTLGVASLSIGVWERERGCLRTLVNVGALGPGEDPRPDDESYPVHTFPALVTLLERRTPYCFGPATASTCQPPHSSSQRTASGASSTIATTRRLCTATMNVVSAPG